MKNASRAAGFTLIELMIVVAIIAILASIAYPAYQQHILRSRRATAAACMMDIAQFMERFHTTNNMRYTGAAIDPANHACVTEMGDFYTFALADVERASYRLTAAPAGAQVKDTKCGTLSLTQAGVKGSTGTESVNDCW